MNHTNTSNSHANAIPQEASFTTGLDNIKRAIHHQPLKTNDSQASERLWNDINHNYGQVYPHIDEAVSLKVAATREGIEDVAIV
jgi:hypothetical protein